MGPPGAAVQASRRPSVRWVNTYSTGATLSIADKARKIRGLAAAEGAITGAVATEQDLPQLDPGAWLITALERCHLAWDVIRISPARQQAKRGPRLTGMKGGTGRTTAPRSGSVAGSG